MRSCLVGVALARSVGLTEHEVADTFYTSLLSHVGCVPGVGQDCGVHRCEGRALGRGYDSTVCEIAREAARRINLADGVQRALFQVKEAWNGSGSPRRLNGEEILLPARIARVASEGTLFYDLGGAELAVQDVVSTRRILARSRPGR
jgi:response regulator RpfG family c-di-GMP phosphodiesterase